MQITIGQRILAAVIAHQLDISTDRALKLYVRGREIDPSWDEVGEELLKNERASTNIPASARPALDRKSCGARATSHELPGFLRGDLRDSRRPRAARKSRCELAAGRGCARRSSDLFASVRRRRDRDDRG